MLWKEKTLTAVMSPTFVLGPGSSLPPAPQLNLLPFSLGSSSRPYTTATAPINSYFRPRPAPAGIPGIEAGTPIAAFRGRQLAGQTIAVPRGYRGVIIAADRPDVVKYSAAADAIHLKGTGVPVSANGDLSEHRKGRGRTRRDQWPLTPATSTASTFGPSSSTATLVNETGDAGPPAGDDDDEGLEMHRSPKRSGFARLKQRVKGAGQVALARPKRATATAVQAGAKRYRLDSDDEEEEEDTTNVVDKDERGMQGRGAEDQPPLHESSFDWVESGHQEVRVDGEPANFTVSGSSAPLPPSTPARRGRASALSTPTRQSPRLAKTDPRTPASSRRSQLPHITLQEATPLKSPLPAPPVHLRRKRNKADYVIPGTAAAVEDTDDPREALIMSPCSSATSCTRPIYSRSPTSSSGSFSFAMQRQESTVIPSPATEDDPPPFPVLSRTSSEVVYTKVEPRDPPPHLPPGTDARASAAGLTDVSGPIRVLRPVASFDSIMLWTTDGPLAGYKPLESPDLKSEASENKDAGGEEKSSASNGVEEGPDVITVRPGWWPQGGSGEGGDEVVRAMGEWLGLVEMVNLLTLLTRHKVVQADIA